MNIDESVFIAEGAIVKGNVTMGPDCSVWYNAVMRADRGSITIGKGTNVQDNAVVHLETGYDVALGDYVTVGHGAIVHGCQVDDNTTVGMGAILLNGCKVGKNCIIGAGALVTQNKVIPDGSLVMGCPGKVVRQLTEEEIASNKANALAYVQEAKEAKEAALS